jgi:hypothetical protein
VEFVALGGYEDHIRPLDDVLMAGGLHGVQSLAWAGKNPWPLVERRALEDV